METLPTPRPAPEQAPLTVSELNREARWLLEGSFPSVLVEGEISNIAMPASGHWYLTLKDDSAQVRCAMFRNRNMLCRLRPRDGMQVLVRGKLSLYEGRGDYQLILEKMEEVGDGALRRAFDALKEKLFREGLFDEARKRDLPSMPRHIGIITSPTGAAIRDMLSILARRFPMIRVTILPVPVQGQGSAAAMIRALASANRRRGCLADLDLVVLTRGGGSLEDLWSFNDEALARAIAASELPVVSAVGHEIDFTIADFVADLRAPTPSAAAEIISPDQLDYFQLLEGYRQQLAALLRGRLQGECRRLEWISRRLQQCHPGRRLQQQAQRLDELEGRLRKALRNHLYRCRACLNERHAALLRHNPLHRLRQHRRDTADLHRRLQGAMRQGLRERRQALAAQGLALQTVSPLATLARGYSITRDAEGRVLRSAQSLSAGDRILTRLHEGSVASTVERVIPKEET